MTAECPECKHKFETGKKKNFALNLIQISWVFETYVLIAFTVVLIMWFPNKFDMLAAVFPQLIALIGGQGIIAGGGPLVSQKLDNEKEK